MELYELMKNIRDISFEAEIQLAIEKTKEKLKDLATERMCKVYSSVIYEELQRSHVPSRIVSTDDLKDGYIHEFVLVPENIEEDMFYLIDLTFDQFPKDKTGIFKSLEEDGYQLINNDSWCFYIQHVTNDKKEVSYSMSDAFYLNSNSENRSKNY